MFEELPVFPDQLLFRFLCVMHTLGRRVVRQTAVAHGLSRTRGAILGRLYHHEEGMMATDLCRCTGVTAASMSKLLSQMERDGLLTRAPHPKDARAMLIHLTAQGEERLKTFPELLAGLDSSVFAGFSDEEREQLRDFLARIGANLDAMVQEEYKE